MISIVNGDAYKKPAVYENSGDLSILLFKPDLNKLFAAPRLFAGKDRQLLLNMRTESVINSLRSIASPYQLIRWEIDCFIRNYLRRIYLENRINMDLQTSMIGVKLDKDAERH